MMKCPTCGSEIVDPSLEYCEHCGSIQKEKNAEEKVKACPSCGAEVRDKEAKFCPECGIINEPSREETSPPPGFEWKKTGKILVSREIAKELLKDHEDVKNLKQLLNERFNEPLKEGTDKLDKSLGRKRKRGKGKAGKEIKPSPTPASPVIAETTLGGSEDTSSDALNVWSNVASKMKEKKEFNRQIKSLFKF